MMNSTKNIRKLNLINLILRGIFLYFSASSLLGCAITDLSEKSARYDQVIKIDARDGVSREELALYHELPEKQLVARRLVEIILDPRKNSCDLGFLEVSESSIIRKLVQTIHIHFDPKSPIHKDIVVNNIKVTTDKIKSIELKLAFQ